MRYANELNIVDPVVITTTDCNSGTSIRTTDDGIITPSFAAAIIVGKSSINLPYLTLQHFNGIIPIIIGVRSNKVDCNH